MDPDVEREHEHSHEHAAEMSAHDHHGHAPGCTDHDCGHSHNWNPWRFAVLLIPVVLFFLDLPNQGFSNVKGLSADQIDLQSNTGLAASTAELIGLAASPASTGPLALVIALAAGDSKPMIMDFQDLEQAAYSPSHRDHYQGRRAEVWGQFAPSASPKVFTLVRYKISCCGADAVPLNVLIVSPEEVSKGRSAWVKVVGKIHFSPKRDKSGYVTVLQIASAKDVSDVPPPKNPYIQ
jgi:hypothetical protein